MGAGGGAAAGERERGREHPAAKEAGWALAVALLQVRAAGRATHPSGGLQLLPVGKMTRRVHIPNGTHTTAGAESWMLDGMEFDSYSRTPCLRPDASAANGAGLVLTKRGQGR